jgi:hypothetical protein
LEAGITCFSLPEVSKSQPVATEIIGREHVSGDPEARKV